MMYFNVIRKLISEDCYYIFSDDDGIIYKGYDLPSNLDDLLILEISGGEEGQGQTLYFDCRKNQYYKEIDNAGA